MEPETPLITLTMDWVLTEELCQVLNDLDTTDGQPENGEETDDSPSAG